MLTKDSTGRITMTPASEPNEMQKEQIKRKYGMFLHFGMNTFINQEWSDGTAQPEQFSPKGIDAEQWVRTAYEAGMNFVILVTKHHDGFCLWDTKYTDYSINNADCNIDVVRQLSKACKKYGIKLGLYYSLWDEHEPSFLRDFDPGYIEFMKNQLTELMDGRYGEVVELWFDGAWKKYCPEWHYEEIYDLVKRLQPKCQFGINHTIGTPGLGDPEERYKPCNYQLYDPIRNFPSDFRLWDPHLCRQDDPKLYNHEGKTYYMPFEQTICSREGFSWFYSDTYEEKPFTPAGYIADSYRQLTAQDNLLVVNMPPNREGKLVEGDINNLFQAADILGIRRSAPAFRL